MVIFVIQTQKPIRMPSNSETGHAKNIANADLLNQKLNGFGASYAPSNALIALAALTAKQAAAVAKQTAVNTQRGLFEPI